FSLKRAASLHVERLVDRLVRDPHRLIIGEVDRQAVRDLLWTPSRRPAPILAATMPASDPTDVRASDLGPVRALDHAGQAVLDVLAQPVILGELGGLGAAGG